MQFNRSNTSSNVLVTGSSSSVAAAAALLAGGQFDAVAPPGVTVSSGLGINKFKSNSRESINT
jgi:hypothetical protein